MMAAQIVMIVLIAACLFAVFSGTPPSDRK